MKHLLLPTCFGALGWRTARGVFGTKLAVTKITFDLEGISHISTAGEVNPLLHLATQNYVEWQ